MLHLTLTLGVLLSPALALFLPTDNGPLKPDDLIQYGVVFDAGSSGTRVRVYTYTLSVGDGASPLGFTGMTEVDRYKVKPGLSTFAKKPQGIMNYLKPHMELAKTVVPKNKRAHTPIFVLATAGMRLEAKQDTEDVMNEVRRILSNTSFNPFNYTRPNVQVLSGEEEGVFAWVALNYILGFFDSYKSPHESTGIMEMGGGSTQIAFIPDSQPWAFQYTLILGLRKYDLYVHSHLNYGKNGVQRQIAEYLAATGTVYNPCLLVGDTQTYLLENGTYVQNIGIGSPQDCLTILATFVEIPTGQEISCQPKPCAVENNYQPQLPNMTYFAVGEFDGTPQDLGVLQSDYGLDIDVLKAEGEHYCQTTVEDATAKGIKRSDVSEDCVMSLYIPTLLGAYGITNTTHVYATPVLKGKGIEWAMGALIVDISERLSGIHSAMRRR